MYNKEFFKRKYNIEEGTVIGDEDGEMSILKFDDLQKDITLHWVNSENNKSYSIFYTYDAFVNMIEDNAVWFVPKKRKVQNNISSAEYNTICPICGSPAYIGLFTVECSHCKGV